MSQISKFLVKKANDLMLARYSMTVNEQRLLLACISQIPLDAPLTAEFEFVLTTEQAQELFYSEKGKHNVYRDMREAVAALYERDAKIILPDGDVLQTRFVSSIVWSADKSTIKVNFAPKILPYLTMLKGNFTRYRLENVVQLTSFYAVRIYELIVYWSRNGEFKQKQIEIDELKQILDIQDKYTQISELKRRVIDIAITQINENTDLLVDVEFKKLKRSFKWIIFTWSRKEDAIQAETERKKRSEHNQQAKEKRIYHEQKQETENKKSENLITWESVPNGTKYRHQDGTTWIKEHGGFFRCIDTNRTAPPFQAPQMLASGNFTLINESEEMNFRQPEHDEMAEYHAKIDEKLAAIQIMPNGQLFQASDRTVYEKRGDNFYCVTYPDDTRPRSLRDAARCWSVDSWKPIDKMPEPSTRSRIFKHYATEDDILADRAKGLNPLDFLTDEEKSEVNEIIEEYQENKDPEIYDFIVNILGIQLDEPKKPSLMARLKRQN